MRLSISLDCAKADWVKNRRRKNGRDFSGFMGLRIKGYSLERLKKFWYKLTRIELHYQ
jgi:hypothetical protein